MFSPDNRTNRDIGQGEAKARQPAGGSMPGKFVDSPIAAQCRKIAEMPLAEAVRNLEFILPLFASCEPKADSSLNSAERRARAERAAREHAMVISALQPLVTGAPEAFVRPLLSRLETGSDPEKVGIIELLRPLNLAVLGQDDTRPVHWAAVLLSTAPAPYVPALLDYIRSRSGQAVQQTLPALVDLFKRIEIRPAAVVDTLMRAGSFKPGRLWQFLDDGLHQHDPAIHAGVLETMAVQVETCANPEILYTAAMSWDRILDFIDPDAADSHDESALAALRVIRRLRKKGLPGIDAGRSVSALCEALAARRLDLVGAEAVTTFLGLNESSVVRVSFLKERWGAILSICSRVDTSEHPVSFPYYVEAVMHGLAAFVTHPDIDTLFREALRSRSPLIAPTAREILSESPQGRQLLDRFEDGRQDDA